MSHFTLRSHNHWFVVPLQLGRDLETIYDLDRLEIIIYIYIYIYIFQTYKLHRLLIYTLSCSTINSKETKNTKKENFIRHVHWIQRLGAPFIVH